LRLAYDLKPEGLDPENWTCNKCNRVLDEHGDHAFTCTFNKGFGVVAHNIIRDKLAQAAQSAALKNVKVTKEKSMEAANFQRTDFGLLEAVKTRPDIVVEVYTNDICTITLIVDVTLASVLTIPSTRDAVRQMGVTIVVRVTKELVAGEGKGFGEVAQAKEKGKIDHYRKRFQIEEEQIYGVAFEKGGYASKGARKLTKDIVDMGIKKKENLVNSLLNSAAMASNIMKDTPIPVVVPKSVRTRQLVEQLSVALQYGNSLLMTSYLRHCVKRESASGSRLGRGPH
jgi:hypothetical protein